MFNMLEQGKKSLVSFQLFKNIQACLIGHNFTEANKALKFCAMTVQFSVKYKRNRVKCPIKEEQHIDNDFNTTMIIKPVVPIQQ